MFDNPSLKEIASSPTRPSDQQWPAASLTDMHRNGYHGAGVHLDASQNLYDEAQKYLGSDKSLTAQPPEFAASAPRPGDATFGGTSHKEREIFEKKTGLHIEAANGTLKYTVANMKDKDVLFETPDTQGGLHSAGATLARLVDKKTRAIEKEFAIGIARAGENVMPQVKTDKNCQEVDGKMLKTRPPMMAELIGLEAAMKHSLPSNRGGEGKGPIRIYFIDGRVEAGSDPTAHYLESDKHNHRAILIEPDMFTDVPVLAKDTTLQDKNRYYTVEAIFTHELGHNSEYNTDWNNPAVEARIATAIGWKKYNDPRTGDSGWLIQGKDKHLYKNDQDSCHSPSSWIPSDEQGDRLNAKGQRVSSVAKAEHIQNVEKQAKYPPPTDYFTNPNEEIAEGIMMYRLSAADRSLLLAKKAPTYWVVKEQDQKEIDQAFGKDKNGKSKMIRGTDGTLVENNARNQLAVKILEKR